MAKVIKAALIAVVVTFIVITGSAALLNAIGTTAATTAAGTLTALNMGAVLATTFVGTLVAGGIGLMMSRGAQQSTDNFGTKTSSRQNIAPRQIIYGRARVGGTIVHMQTTGTDNHKLCMIIVVSGHAVDGFSGVRINDVNTTNTSSTISGETVFRVTNAELKNADNDNAFTSGSLIRFTFHDGTQTARDGLAAATLGGAIPTTHKFINCAYFYFEMVFDSEALASVPQISFTIRGKNVYDPRTGAAATTEAQRTNPALQIRDYLTDTTYGLGCESSEINDTTNAGGFAAAANTCDQQVTLADNSTQETRYKSSGFTTFAASGEDAITAIQSAMSGRLTYTNGVFNLFAGAAQTPALTITDDDLLAPVNIDTGSGGARGDLYNQVKAIFVDSDNDFKAGETAVITDNTMLSQDTPSSANSANFRKTLEIRLPFTTSETMAQRLAKIQLRYQRKTMMLSVQVPIKFIRLQPADFVYVTNERMGFSQKLFEVQDVVMGLDEAQDGVFFASCSLSLREIAADVWNFATNEYSTAIGQGSVVNTGSFSKDPPTIGTLTQRAQIQGPHTVIDIIVPWTNQVTDAVQGTEVQYKLSGESDYAVATVAGKGQTRAVIQNVVVGNTYNVKLRHFSFDNVYSDFSSQANITIAESDTLALPSSVSATTGQALFIEVKWTNPANTNLRAVELHASSTSGFTPSTGTLVNSYYGDVGKTKRVIFGKSSAFGFDYGVTYYFRLRAINVFGTATAYTSQVSGSFVRAGNSDVEQLNADRITAGTIATARLNVTDIISNGSIAVTSDLSSFITGGDVNSNVTNISGGAIQTGTVSAARIDVSNIVIGNLSGASSFKGGLSNLTNPSSGVTPIGAGDVNGNVTSISGGVISTGTINANRINIDGVTLDTDGSNQLIIKGSGVDSPQIKSNALGTIRGDTTTNQTAQQFTNNTRQQFLLASPFHTFGVNTLQLLVDLTFTTPLTTASLVDYVIAMEGNASGTFSSSADVMIATHIQRTNSLGDSYDVNGTRSGDHNVFGFSFATGTSAGAILRKPVTVSLRGGSTIYVKVYGFQKNVTNTPQWDNNFISAQALAR